MCVAYKKDGYRASALISIFSNLAGRVTMICILKKSLKGYRTGCFGNGCSAASYF
jgi:hypothetical protein